METFLGRSALTPEQNLWRSWELVNAQVIGFLGFFFFLNGLVWDLTHMDERVLRKRVLVWSRDREIWNQLRMGNLRFIF